ncbi:TPA: phosphomannomutase/phosphoglucomutase [Neisseria meningitidis]|uniref:Phosphoglucomutase n=1 Tax=Neisseria meningitidis alpha153 TaxID=663926 RepID=C6SD15_NEIME|nr:phosphomannomutase/phosphoglucomutase [Neisseria meningitidis]CBA06595.1 phosphoglucomutase [Neisseria meningitidis alpha153]EJU74663.1 phosphoglucomutase/phosphomannomutase, C-terminal domain protein [Neisseria meningitidis NM2657]MBG8844730.1 phosphomannomutase/phosphoglucomutase [Neisseria meningitidis]MBG8861608.1 phosphomannomutase/phosphoglucomutase [Neisseria meningitidis]MBJ7854491.1 phosphomannomutase/phosphoglucomutase [Neisseria meningitidis]
MASIARDIFKAYDIRGIVGKTLTDEAAYLIGKAIAAKAAEKGITRIALGRDGRLSGPELMEHIRRGFTDSGINVLNVGMVATPMLYFAAVNECGGSGVMITGSHNPPDYNGFKMMLGGDTLAGEAIQELLSIIEKDGFVAADKQGNVTEKDISGEYHNHIVGHIKLKRPMKIAIDAGNGVGGAFAGKLYKGLGNEVTELFCDVDGTFPNHHPDPSKPKNLQDLIAALKNGDAEIGLAFDGDADRLGVVTKDGNIIYPDRQLMLFAQDVLNRNPGAKVIFDVKSTRLLAPWIKEHGGKAIMEKTGHSFIKSAMKETGAPVAGEMSGHIFFKERWFGFDDGLYAGARLLEILSASDNPSEVLNNLPQSISTPELNIALPEGSNGHQVIDELAAKAEFEGATEIITIDGLRVEFPDGFGLMRASNTTPILVLRFEADTQEAIERIQNQFKAVIESNPNLIWPL